MRERSSSRQTVGSSQWPVHSKPTFYKKNRECFKVNCKNYYELHICLVETHMPGFMLNAISPADDEVTH